VVIVTMFAVLLSVRHREAGGARSGAYYTLLMLGAVGMMLVASATDFLLLFFSLELTAASGYLLTAIAAESPRSREAALKFFLLGTFATGLLAYGMSLLYGLSGSTQFSALGHCVAGGANRQPLLWVGSTLLLAGLMFKIGVVPFHQWVPDSYEGAPTSVTVLLSTSFMVAAFAPVLRILVIALLAWHEALRLIVTGLGIATLSLGSLAALTQNNIKRFFGYSAISHAGWLLLGLIAGLTRPRLAGTEHQAERDGLVAVLIYLLVYAVATLGALGVVSLMRRQEVVGEEMDDLGGLMAHSPGYAVLMLAFLLSLSGIPPTAGFIGKYLVLLSAMETGHRRLTFMAIFWATVMAYCYLRIAALIFAKPEAEGLPLRRSPTAAAALLVSAVATIIVGLDPQPVIVIAQQAVQSLF
jgi:NADH-quinone oxidoreductase subunit N